MADLWDDGYNHGWYDALTAIQDIIGEHQASIVLKNTPDWYEYHDGTLTKITAIVSSLLEQNKIEEENE